MIRIQSKVYVEKARGQDIYDFLIEPTDEAYQRWWPGTHLQLHVLKSRPGHLGDLVYMDEYIGKRRLRMQCIVSEAVPGQRLVWQMKKIVLLPARLVMQLDDDDGGVLITHTIEAGFEGVGRILDPLLRLYLSPQFARAMDEHAQAEFPALGRMLSAT